MTTRTRKISKQRAVTAIIPTPAQLAALAALTTDQLKSVYSGQPGCCCGCRGRHVYHPRHAEDVLPRDISRRSVATILGKIQRMASDKAAGVQIDVEFTFADDFVSAETPTRLLIAYRAPK